VGTFARDVATRGVATRGVATRGVAYRAANSLSQAQLARMLDMFQPGVAPLGKR
jgi:hypothetical protein